jgi:hypothetical protein
VSQVYIDEEILNKYVSFESLKIKAPQLTASHRDDDILNEIQLSEVQHPVVAEK